MIARLPGSPSEGRTKAFSLTPTSEALTIGRVLRCSYGANHLGLRKTAAREPNS